MAGQDEYANHVDNGAFTNAGIKVIMGIAQVAAKLVGETAPSGWEAVEENIFIPFNTNASIIPEYGTMNGSVKIKQADVVLVNYPLEFRLNESQALNDLDFVGFLATSVLLSRANVFSSMLELSPPMALP